MATRTATRLDWFFSKEFLGYTRKWCAQHQWRLKTGGDEEDLFQEAWLVFRRVVETYPEVTSRRHLMRLYQTSLFRETHDLASREWVVQELDDETGEPVDPDSFVGPGLEDLELAVRCLCAPVAVVEVLSTILSVDPKGMTHRRYVANPHASRRTRRSKLVRETTMEMFTRVVGARQAGAVKQLRALLRGSV